MSYAEDILKLRKRVQDAVARGVVTNDGKDFLEATMIQIMNDAERNRQNCVSQADNLRKQAAQFDGQAGAFASMSSIVYNVLNGFVTIAERDEAERAAEEEEKSRLAAENLESNKDSAAETVEKKKYIKKKTA